MTDRDEAIELAANHSVFKFDGHTCTDAQKLSRALLSEVEKNAKLEAERDKLFLELGKYADVPSYEYWQDKCAKLLGEE